MTDNLSFLRLTHVSKTIQNADFNISILRDVNLTIKSGETVAILGASGSGKTTLLTLIAGLDLPSSGEIKYKTKTISNLSEEERTLLRGKEMGFIFQNFQLLPTLTAVENVMLPLEINYIAPHKAKKIAISWLAKVGLAERLNHYPSQLSGGEAQRVAIARAFVRNPKLLLADEMTGNLDVETGEMIADLVFQLNQEQQTTLILVTHDAELANRCHLRKHLAQGELHSC